MKNQIMLPLAALTILGACAQGTADITPQYTSPMQYNSYSCSQIEQEMRVVARHVSNVGGEVDKQHSNDQARMGVGLVLLWPTLFFLDGDTPQAVEYARLSGEFDALEKAAIQKDCNIKIEKPKPAVKEDNAKKIPDYPSSKN